MDIKVVLLQRFINILIKKKMKESGATTADTTLKGKVN